MIEDLRKAELVRDRLESLDQSAKAYPEGYDMHALIEGLHVDRALGAVENTSAPFERPSLPSRYLSSHRFQRKLSKTTGANNTLGVLR